MSWQGESLETNPHFWLRDRPQPPSDQPGPSRQQPGRKIRQRERPDHVQLPPPIEPVVSKPRPPQPGHRTHRPEHVPPPRPILQTHDPEFELTPAGRSPDLVLPLSQDHWPVHPHEPIDDHWPLHPHIQAGHEGPPLPLPLPQPHPHPKRQQPQAGPNLVQPPSQDHWHPDEPSEHNWTLNPDIQPGQERRPPQPHPHAKTKRQQPQVGPTTDRPHHKRQEPHVGPTMDRPPRRQTPPGGRPDHGRRPHREQNLIYPSPNRTNAFTWFIAVFCVILWVVIILGGILILIIYLAYRPRSPHFEISDASLNAAYLDMGYLLNADLTLLVNFTNMNHKMSVDFNFIVLKLRYENHLIANQYIEPFSAGKLEKKFARVEMVGSQIRLPVLVTQQLVRQIQGNRITFEIDGYFHARSRLGSIFRYSYWLYSHCTIVTTGPPSGVMVDSNCVTKR